jgi:hypothetical protein
LGTIAAAQKQGVGARRAEALEAPNEAAGNEREMGKILYRK